MVLYKCNNCLKEFDKKDNFIKHTERKKKPCRQNITLIQNNPFESILIQKSRLNLISDKNDNKFIENMMNIDNIVNIDNLLLEDDFTCEYCGKTFYNNANLHKHIRNNSCKVKKLQDQEKENIFKILLAKDEEIKELIEYNKKTEENNKELKEYIKKLTDMNLDLNHKVSKLIEKVTVQNINKGIINNNINNNINNFNNIIISANKLVNFGTEDVKQIDNELFKNLQGKIGKYVFIECAKNIYNNDSKNKTLYFSDLSREKAMAFLDGKFQLIPMDKAINTVNDQIRKYIKHNEVFYNERLKIPEVKKNYEEGIKKWFKMYYSEYDENDRYEPSPERIEEFNKVVQNGLKEFFFNIKDNVKNNHNNILQEIQNDSLFKKIDFKQEKKLRGRPKKI